MVKTQHDSAEITYRGFDISVRYDAHNGGAYYWHAVKRDPTVVLSHDTARKEIDRAIADAIERVNAYIAKKNAEDTVVATTHSDATWGALARLRTELNLTGTFDTLADAIDEATTKVRATRRHPSDVTRQENAERALRRIREYVGQDDLASFATLADEVKSLANRVATLQSDNRQLQDANKYLVKRSDEQIGQIASITRDRDSLQRVIDELSVTIDRVRQAVDGELDT